MDSMLGGEKLDIKQADQQAMEVISRFDSSNAPISEAQICDVLRSIRQQLEQTDITSRIWMEEMTFLFSESGRRGESQWGTYFGPFITGTNETGQYESPSIKQVTPEIIDYWKKRVADVKHPVLKARYAGLVWDFSEAIIGKSADVIFARTRIDSILEMVSSDFNKYDIDVFSKLEHALSLSLSLRDEERTGKVVAAISQFEEKIAVDDKAGLWGHSFDLLFNKKVHLSLEQEATLVSDMEGRLERLSNPEETSNLNPWAAEKAALALARYYRIKGQNEESRSALLKYAHAFEKMAATANATLSSAWFQQVAKVFKEFGLKHEAEELLKKIRALGEQVKGEMKQFSKTVTITAVQNRTGFTSGLLIA